MDSLNAVGSWYLVEIEGTRPMIEPAFSAEQAQATVSEALNAAGVPNNVKKARTATARDLEEFVEWFDDQIADGVSPPAWRKRVRDMVASHLDDRTPTPPDRLVLSRGPTSSESATVATVWRLVNIVQAVGMLVVMASITWGLVFVMSSPGLYVVVVGVVWLVGSLFGAEWLNRHSGMTGVPDRPRPRVTRASERDDARAIMAHHLATVGEWCTGDEHCVPAGHVHPKEDLQVDHVRPFSKGGTLAEDGGRVICAAANRARGNSPIRAS